MTRLPIFLGQGRAVGDMHAGKGDDAPSNGRLLAVLNSEYSVLRDRLALRLSSSDEAGEALDEAWLRLETGGHLWNIRTPRSYLFRMALNLARNARRKAARQIAVPDIVFLDLPDSAPDPEIVALDRDEESRMWAGLDALPERHKGVFLARWRDEMSLAEIASKFGMHPRSVQKDLARAEKHLRRSLGRDHPR